MEWNEAERDEIEYKLYYIVCIFYGKVVFHPIHPNWSENKCEKKDGMRLNEYHHIPFHLFLKNPNNRTPLYTT